MITICIFSPVLGTNILLVRWQRYYMVLPTPLRSPDIELNVTYLEENVMDTDMVAHACNPGLLGAETEGWS